MAVMATADEGVCEGSEGGDDKKRRRGDGKGVSAGAAQKARLREDRGLEGGGA